MIMFNFLDRAYGLWWDTILIHEKGVLEFVKEQQFFIHSHIILVVQWYVDYCWKRLSKILLIFPFIEDGLVFFNWRRGISLIPRNKKAFTVTVPVLPVKGTFYVSWKVRLYRKSLPFLNAHHSCTVSVCDKNLRNDLTKDTNYTTKRITIERKSHQEWKEFQLGWSLGLQR